MDVSILCCLLPVEACYISIDSSGNFTKYGFAPTNTNTLHNHRTIFHLSLHCFYVLLLSHPNSNVVILHVVCDQLTWMKMNPSTDASQKVYLSVHRVMYTEWCTQSDVHRVMYTEWCTQSDVHRVMYTELVLYTECMWLCNGHVDVQWAFGCAMGMWLCNGHMVVQWACMIIVCNFAASCAVKLWVMNVCSSLCRKCHTSLLIWLY